MTFLAEGNIFHPVLESSERTSNDERDVHPPQVKIVEFGEEDVVVCSVSGGITGPGDITEGPDTDWE